MVHGLAVATEARCGHVASNGIKVRMRNTSTQLKQSLKESVEVNGQKIIELESLIPMLEKKAAAAKALRDAAVQLRLSLIKDLPIGIVIPDRVYKPLIRAIEGYDAAAEEKK